MGTTNMSWNYRLFKQDNHEVAVKAGEPYLFFVGECYYNDNDEPELHSTMDHNNVNGETEAEVRDTYTQMGEAFRAPVIELDVEGNFK